MEFIEFSKFFSRQDIIDFYMKIDIQIVWRPYHKILSNPLKIVNAASFGIPTIALDEKAFREMAHCYIKVGNFADFLIAIDELRTSPVYYDGYSARCIKKAELYHIENVAKLYQQL